MRILLIEDHPIVRAACRGLLQVKGGMEIAEAATAADGLSMATEFSPDIIVLDLRLPDGNGLDLLRPLLSHACGPKIIVFSMYEDPVFAAQALEAGAKGYMTKNDDPDILLDAIDKVGSGGLFLTASMAEKLALMTAGPEDNALRDLSSREWQVLALLGLGKTLAEVADELHVSYRTSAHIAAQIRTKLGVTSTAALIKWVVDHPRLSSPLSHCP